MDGGTDFLERCYFYRGLPAPTFSLKEISHKESLQLPDNDILQGTRSGQQ